MYFNLLKPPVTGGLEEIGKASLVFIYRNSKSLSDAALTHACCCTECLLVIICVCLTFQNLVEVSPPPGSSSDFLLSWPLPVCVRCGSVELPEMPNGLRCVYIHAAPLRTRTYLSCP